MSVLRTTRCAAQDNSKRPRVLETRAPVAIVGAGSAGLAAAAALGRRGIPAVLLERGAGVGSSWRLRHPELRLNTVRRLSDLPGLRMPRSVGRWATRDDYIAYLEAYAEHRRLDVRLGAKATAIERSGHPRWTVRTTDGDTHADHVVIATGHERVPRTPDWPGRDGFTQPLMHVAGQRRAADLAGKRVLLVGAGNSGVEFAEQLVAASVAELWISVRTPPNILPLALAGIPLQRISVALGGLPERWRDAAARRIARHAFGDLTPYGLPAPTQGPFRRLRETGVTAAVDRGFVEHLKAGRLRVVPEIHHLRDTMVVLRNGDTLWPDVVVAATGYRPALESLVGHLGVLDADGQPKHRTARIGVRGDGAVVSRAPPVIGREPAPAPRRGAGYRVRHRPRVHRTEQPVSPIPDRRWLAALLPFVRDQLPAVPARVLEIGCGPLGGFVPELAADGYDVVGVDPEAPVGPAYRRIGFEQYRVGQPMDAVVACTSLHHVAALGDVLDRVADALVPGGTFVVVEWARERLDAATARWCFDRLPTGEGGWLHRHRAASAAATGQSWQTYVDSWAEDEGLHRGADIIEALHARFERRQLELGPYFFPDLDNVSEDDEQAAIDAGLVRATGIRYVGRI